MLVMAGAADKTRMKLTRVVLPERSACAQTFSARARSRLPAMEPLARNFALVLAGGHYVPDIGDRVWVWRKQWNDRGDSHGRITARLDTEGRVAVEYTAGGKYDVRVPRVVKLHAGPAIVVCYDTNTYRRHCFAQPLPTDRCVEIGSSYGAATAIIARRCESVLGIGAHRCTVCAEADHATLGHSFASAPNSEDEACEAQ